MKRTKKGGHSKERGSALTMVVSALVILLLLGSGLLGLDLQSQLLAARTAAGIVARSAADAGLTKALFEMNEMLQVEPWDDGVLPGSVNERLPNCEATFSYAVTGDMGNGYVIESVGKSGWVERRVGSSLRVQGLFEYAVFAQGDIDLAAAAAVDWYNYDEDDGNLQIGSHSVVPGAIELKNRSMINGDVVVGVGGDPAIVITDNGAIITGRAYAMVGRHHVPRITVPGWLASLPSGGTIRNDTTISSSGKYDEINLKKGRELEIEENVALYIVGDVTLGKSASIMIEDDTSLILFIGGDYEGKSGSSLNNETRDPGKLKVYGLESCNYMRFKNGTELYGAIYAPNAEVTFDNSADAYGSVVARRFVQRNSAAFHYDASLRDVDVDDDGVRFVVGRWSEE